MGIETTTELDNITYADFQKLSQKAVYYTLKDNISVEYKRHIGDVGNVDLLKRINYPHIIIPLPKTVEIRRRHDYNVKKKEVRFEIDVHTLSVVEDAKLPSLVIDTLDNNRTALSDVGLTKFKALSVTPDFEFDPNTEKKYYKTTIEIYLEWNGS